MESLKNQIQNEIDIDVYNQFKIIKEIQKQLENKERELFEKERELLKKEKELFEKEKQYELERKSVLTNKIPQLILLKQDNNYWTQNAFKDLIIEGDLDKLEWIKNNHGIVHFGVIHSAITHPDIKIREWFNINCSLIYTQESFLTLLEHDIKYRFSNLTWEVLDKYNKNNCFINLNNIILSIFEYSIKCNNSLIIEWFEKNIVGFEKTAISITKNNYKIKNFYEESVHKNYGYQDSRNVHYKPWFDKYFSTKKQEIESLRAKGYWKDLKLLERIIITRMFDSTFDYNRYRCI